MAKAATRRSTAKPRRSTADARRGLEIRRQVLGPENVDRSLAATKDDAFISMFFDFTHVTCFNDLWGRPGLDWRERSMLTLAIAASHGQAGAVKRHVRSALRNGISKQEIGEILLQVYVYAGVYNALSSFIAAREEFDVIEAEDKAARAASRAKRTAKKKAATKKTTARKPATRKPSRRRTAARK
jgi:alkylhydroperoxidase/carboxymuconolactone decarboxylase family protein YurZ